MSQVFESEVALRYQVYNSLFLGLPFDSTHTTGVHLPIFLDYCKKGLAQDESPEQILSRFLKDNFPFHQQEEQFAVLFNIIQYIERQVVLFDAIENSAFAALNDLGGDGTFQNLVKKIRHQQKLPAFAEKIANFSLHLVLTAHPTQFYPRNVLAIISELEDAIQKNNIQAINLLLIQLGKTPFINQQKPTPLDEAVSLIWYLENIFYDAVSSLIFEVQEFASSEQVAFKHLNLISLGFWPGGDRDGNPNVSAEMTQQVLAELKNAVLRKYYQDVNVLKKRLTFKYTAEIISNIETRLYATLHNTDNAYLSDNDLLADLYAARLTLSEHHNNLFIEQVDNLIQKVSIFGFHFAALDIRQDSRVHRALFANLLKQNNTIENNKATQLLECFTSKAHNLETLANLELNISAEALDSASEKDVLESLRNIFWAQSINGDASCFRYIISNNQSAADVLLILKLAHWLTNSKKVALDIIPLFESINDLHAAAEIMQALFENPLYLTHLQGRNLRQTIMLGFSDGTKDGGYFATNWAIYRAKETLTNTARKSGIELVFFDGRGGPPARGGGNTNKFYSSLGSSIEQKAIELTIQGQTVSSNFGTLATARYNIEQLLCAGVENEIFHDSQAELNSEQRALLEKISALSFAAYQDLKNDELFLPYLEQFGTLNYYGLTNISSRPTKRGSSEKRTLADLRAIPFVSAWAQLKQNVPGFYGLGSALSQLNESGELPLVQKLYAESLFFRTLINNSMQVLLKTNFDLTRYISKDPTFANLWNKIYEEFKLARNLILKISGSKELLEMNSEIKASIKLREEIVLPLLVMQQAAIEKLNSLGSTESVSRSDLKEEAELKNLQSIILRTMFGIINAGRNSV